MFCLEVYTQSLEDPSLKGETPCSIKDPEDNEEKKKRRSKKEHQRHPVRRPPSNQNVRVLPPISRNHRTECTAKSDHLSTGKSTYICTRGWSFLRGLTVHT